MNNHVIGVNAGIIWHLLCGEPRLNYEALRKEAQLNEKEFAAALGWLAREGQIEFYEQEEGLYISLKCNVFFG